MTHENDNDFYKLNFSQREGKVPLPEPMRLGSGLIKGVFFVSGL